MSWSVADASLALFHHTSFDYPVKTESETLEHIGSYAGHLPFAADSHVRPDGYGLLDHQLLQSIPVPMPVSTPKYSRFPGGFEIPPFRFHLASGSFLASTTHTICQVPCFRFKVSAFAQRLASGCCRRFVGTKSADQNGIACIACIAPTAMVRGPVTRITRRT
ncbi:MAG: hypothetical protein LQ341_002187 [Variospora aurantia]|nr:MAG: hypothetical protein LQ341_002187 [Variospora aurantia]